MADRLPQLLDAKHLATELGITRAAAEKIMQSLPIVQVPGLRKVYVRRLLSGAVRSSGGRI